ncbi:unnamed protein product [Dovyalis caffra]|uniref:LOB domain-containing protein n=1 Tax=Dovyalis caffra TaxID=77055 RepID=A0AAV1RB60_9ROSI|nr:unnamed protein product [Dovyalis caffra]
MSCNGCRILRKGCNEDCVLRQCIEWINNPQAQANATVFVAKFFGRAGLMSFISSVPQSQRPCCGENSEPSKWSSGASLDRQLACMPEGGDDSASPRGSRAAARIGGGVLGPEFDNVSECGSFRPPIDHVGSGSKTLKRKRDDDVAKCEPTTDLDLCLLYQRADTPSEESETTTLESGSGNNCRFHEGGEPKLLRLFG